MADEQERHRIELSVVVPMYNEEAVVELLFHRLRPVLDRLATSYEVVCVDDGSRDQTAAIVMRHLDAWPQLRLVRLLRNTGHQAALSAGFSSAFGDLVVTIDADLQDPPEAIADMVQVARRDNVDVVYGVRADRSSDSWFKRATSGLYYRLMRRLVGGYLPHDAGDFRLVNRRVIDAMAELPSRSQVHRLIIPWFGFPSAQVTYVRDPRAAGVTKYPLRKMVALAVESTVAFSAAPLRVATWTGFVGGVLALGLLGWSLWGALAGVTVPGWASTMATVGLIGAIQLVCLGMLGEYVSRMFVASQGRPDYVVGYDSWRETADGEAPAATVPAARAPQAEPPSGPPRIPRTRTAGPGAAAPAVHAGSANGASGPPRGGP